MKKSIIILSFMFLLSPFIVNAQDYDSLNLKLRNWGIFSEPDVEQKFKIHKWDIPDKILFSFLVSFHVIDSLQTSYIFNHPERYREENPIIKKGVDQIGKGFIPLYFIGFTGLEFLVINDMKSSLMRKTTLFLFNINAFSFVANNYDIGIGLNFWF